MGVEVCPTVGVSVPGASLPQPESRRATIDKHTARASQIGLRVRVSNTTSTLPFNTFLVV